MRAVSQIEALFGAGSRAPASTALRRAALAALIAAGIAGCADNLTSEPLDAYVASDPAPLACLPNLDGRIDADELKAALNVPARYRVSPAGTERTVDLVGTVDPDGHRVWDYSVDLADDQLAVLMASSLDGKWYAASFPQGQFVAPFDAGDTVEQVLSQDDQALWLHGLASVNPDGPGGQTLIVYDSPVALLQFPLQVGSGWISTGEVKNGTLRDLPYAGRDTYEVKVAASGEVRLPDLSFSQALKISTRVTIEPAVGEATSQRQVGFYFECFGEVARVTSRPGEMEEDFTAASEVRRLGF